MKIVSGTVSGVSRLQRVRVELSRKARQRLKWFDYYDSRGGNARGEVSRCSFYRHAHSNSYRGVFEVTDSSFDLSALREEPLEWEQAYIVRPHQALGYVTRCLDTLS